MFTQKQTITSIDSLQKQISNSVSMFTTVRDNLKKVQENLSKQVELRDAEIQKLTEERCVLNDMHTKSENIINKINSIID